MVKKLHMSGYTLCVCVVCRHTQIINNLKYNLLIYALPSCIPRFSTAMYNLGNCYKCARGVLKDLNKAKEWYTKAVGKGHDAVQTVLDELNAA